MLTWSRILKIAREGNPPSTRDARRTNEEWRELLPPEVYRITREHGTERPGSGAYCAQFGPGIYNCRCCGEPLFDSSAKFESGSGWPSFTQPVAPHAISYHADTSFGMIRVETRCNACDAHLGHVFPDGPAPSGLRYCMNSLALAKQADAAP